MENSLMSMSSKTDAFVTMRATKRKRNDLRFQTLELEGDILVEVVFQNTPTHTLVR